MRQGCSQDLNRPFQDIAQNLDHYDADVIIGTLWKNVKNFKYCAISLNMLHTSGLCRVLGFTAPLILISKEFQSKYIYTLISALYSPIALAAINTSLQQ